MVGTSLAYHKGRPISYQKGRKSSDLSSYFPLTRRMGLVIAHSLLPELTYVTTNRLGQFELREASNVCDEDQRVYWERERGSLADIRKHTEFSSEDKIVECRGGPHSKLVEHDFDENGKLMKPPPATSHEDIGHESNEGVISKSIPP
jgi:hypothetical protein